jgi:hypothetical protein
MEGIVKPLARIAWVGFASLLAAAPVNAVPLTFTVDTAASNLGDSTIALSGTLSGDFDVFDRTVTFSSGSIAAPPSNGQATLPPTVIFDGVAPLLGQTEVTASGTGNLDLPSLSLSVTGGTVADGGSASPITSTSVNGVGSASGEILLEADSLLFDPQETVGFSATGNPVLSFGSPTGTVELTSSGNGARLALPIQLAAPAADIDLVPEPDGILTNFQLLESFVTDYVAAQLVLPGTLVATSATALPGLPDPVSYAVDPARSAVSAGPFSTTLGGTVAGQWYQGELDFSGGSSVLASLGVGAQPDLLIGNVAGFDYDIDLASVSLDLVFDILSGRVTDGSPVSALDAILAQGALTILGHASFDAGFGISVDSPFALMSDVSFDLDLLNPDATVGLLTDSGIETLTIPLAFSLASYTTANTVVDYDGGLIEAAANLLSSLLAPQILTQAAAQLPLSVDYTGTLVATRETRNTAATPVPEPATWLLLVAALPLLALRRRVSRA